MDLTDEASNRTPIRSVRKNVFDKRHSDTPVQL